MRSDKETEIAETSFPRVQEWFIDGDISCVLLTNTAFEGMTGRLRDEVQRAVRPPRDERSVVAAGRAVCS